jgi:hypothetical protein
MAYYETDPFGLERGDAQAAQISAILAEIHRNRDMRVTPYEPKEFMPNYSKAIKKQQSPRDMLNLAREITLAMGGTVKE